MATQMKIYSRPGKDDDCDQGYYEYNGSITLDGAREALTYEDHAKAFDCFYEVLFCIKYDNGHEIALPYTRTYE